MTPLWLSCGSEAFQEEFNKLRAYEASLRTSVAGLVTLANELKADFNGHTHRGDGAQAGLFNTSTPQGDAQTVAPVTARAVAAVDATALPAAQAVEDVTR